MKQQAAIISMFFLIGAIILLGAGYWLLGGIMGVWSIVSLTGRL